MANSDVMKTIKEYQNGKKINPYYELEVSDLLTIIDNSQEAFDHVRYGFILGYIQGMRACKVEMKKRGAKTCQK